MFDGYTSGPSESTVWSANRISVVTDAPLTFSGHAYGDGVRLSAGDAIEVVYNVTSATCSICSSRLQGNITLHVAEASTIPYLICQDCYSHVAGYVVQEKLALLQKEIEDLLE